MSPLSALTPRLLSVDTGGMWLTRWWMWPLPLTRRTPAQQRRDRQIGVALVGVMLVAFGLWLFSGLDGQPSRLDFWLFIYAACFCGAWLLYRIAVPAVWAHPSYRRVHRWLLPVVGAAFGLRIAHGRHGWDGSGTKAGIVAGVAVTVYLVLRERATRKNVRPAPARNRTVGPVVVVHLSRDELASRLGIRFEDEWDGTRFVGSSSFDAAGVGRVTFVAKQGENDVELHLESGATVTLEELAQGLGLSPAHLV